MRAKHWQSGWRTTTPSGHAARPPRYEFFLFLGSYLKNDIAAASVKQSRLSARPIRWPHWHGRSARLQTVPVTRRTRHLRRLSRFVPPGATTPAGSSAASSPSGRSPRGWPTTLSRQDLQADDRTTFAPSYDRNSVFSDASGRGSPGKLPQADMVIASSFLVSRPTARI